MCSNQSISCVPVRAFPVFQSEHFFCSNQSISCVPIRAFLVLQSEQFLCANQRISCVPITTFLPSDYFLGHQTSDRPGNLSIRSKKPRGSWFWRPKIPSSSKICRKLRKTEKKSEKKVQFFFRRQKIESCKSSEARVAEVSRRSEPCSRGKRTFKVRRCTLLYVLVRRR